MEGDTAGETRLTDASEGWNPVATATPLPGFKHALRRLIISVLIDLADLQTGNCELRFAMGDYFRTRSQGAELPYLELVSGPLPKPAPSRKKPYPCCAIGSERGKQMPPLVFLYPRNTLKLGHAIPSPDWCDPRF